MSSLRSTSWRQQCSGAPTYTCCRARILASTSRRGSVFGARRWLPDHRGAEGALVFPYTDEAGGVLKEAVERFAAAEGFEVARDSACDVAGDGGL